MEALAILSFAFFWIAMQLWRTEEKIMSYVFFTVAMLLAVGVALGEAYPGSAVSIWEGVAFGLSLLTMSLILIYFLWKVIIPVINFIVEKIR